MMPRMGRFMTAPVILNRRNTNQHCWLSVSLGLRLMTLLFFVFGVLPRAHGLIVIHIRCFCVYIRRLADWLD